MVYMGAMLAGWVAFIFGYKWSIYDGVFYWVQGNGGAGIVQLGHYTPDGHFAYA